MEDKGLGLKETGKVVIAGIVFGKVVATSVANGLVDELKDLRPSDMLEAIILVKNVFKELKTKEVVDQVSDHVDAVADVTGHVMESITGIVDSIGDMFSFKRKADTAKEVEPKAVESVGVPSNPAH